MERSSFLLSKGAKPWQGRAPWRVLAVAARAFGRPRFCVEWSSLLLSRGAKPWRGRALDGSGGSGARFWMSAVLRGMVLTSGFDGGKTVARAYSRGPGGSGARFWTSAVLRGMVLTFGLEGRETVARTCSGGLWR